MRINPGKPGWLVGKCKRCKALTWYDPKEMKKARAAGREFYILCSSKCTELEAKALRAQNCDVAVIKLRK